jgi:hypothetical protein
LRTLGENLEQKEPAERAVLEELRAGIVATAVRSYQEHGRIRIGVDRDEALGRPVKGECPRDCVTGVI